VTVMQDISFVPVDGIPTVGAMKVERYANDNRLIPA
jgi:hypothetical protein